MFLCLCFIIVVHIIIGNDMNYHKILPVFTGLVIATLANGCKKARVIIEVLFTSSE